MEKFTELISTSVPMPMEDIDTDQIIPARFLKSISQRGFGENLFRDWKYDKNGNANNDFILNNPTYSGKILVAGRNFGCGSSREHAVWALYDYGFRVIISSYFADIFKGNALNNGLLPITVDGQTLDFIFKSIESDQSFELKVDLAKQLLTSKNGLSVNFEIDEFKKSCLMNGFDEIDFLLNMEKEIVNFELKKVELN